MPRLVSFSGLIQIIYVHRRHFNIAPQLTASLKQVIVVKRVLVRSEKGKTQQLTYTVGRTGGFSKILDP